MDVGKGKSSRSCIRQDFECNRDGFVEGPRREVHREVVATNPRQMRTDARAKRPVKNA
jgi:hypothetical protein